jgi:hypothetical protein
MIVRSDRATLLPFSSASGYVTKKGLLRDRTEVVIEAEKMRFTSAILPKWAR